VIALVKTSVRDESSATAIEYSLIASLISVAIIIAVGKNVANTFGKVAM
jgi:pilus assembly protein Flp/PilA